MSYPFRFLNKIALNEMMKGYKRDKTMNDEYMYITNDGTKNYSFCRLNLVVKMFEHSTNHTFIKSPKS